MSLAIGTATDMTQLTERPTDGLVEGPGTRAVDRQFNAAEARRA